MMLQYAFSGLKTKRVVFEEVFSVLDSASLEQLKELSAKRRLIEESINETSCITTATAREMFGGLTSRNQQDLLKVEQYLPLLQNFIIHVDSISARLRANQWTSDLRIRWTTTMNSSSAFKLNRPKFFQVDSLKYELGMTLFLYGLILRERAFELFQEDLPQSASLLKKSAGVYNYLSTEVLPSLQSVLPPEKPPEATTNVSSAMSLICLADAQAIAIKIAEKRDMSAGLLAKLHHGVSEFLDEALALLQSGTRDVSGKFLEFMHSCRTLHELRSHRHLAVSCEMSKQIGSAIGLLNRALKNVNKPREKSWKEVFDKEVTEVSDILKKYNKENDFVWHDKVPLDFELPALESTKTVTAIPYEPQRWERQIAFKT